MERIAAFLALAACAYGGSIQGVALEHVSGRPLARTVVRLEPVAKPNSPSGVGMVTRAGRSGHFVFPAVAPGLYLITGEREGFFPAAFGQRLPTGRAVPVAIGQDTSLFAELRLRHKGAVTGRVTDENGVGRPGTTVIAYRARLPLRSAGSAVSDDRGVYRIHGLPPGRFWVRSASQTLDDGSGWLPTYGPQGQEVREARVHRVTVDTDTTDADVSPEAGALFRVGGKILCDTPVVVTVVLSSETGRRQAQCSCNGEYSFDAVAPGYYEVYARANDESASGFVETYLGGDNLGVNIQVLRVPPVDIEVHRAGRPEKLDVQVTLYGRRQDLSETGVAREIKGSRVTLAPGHWEFRAQAPDGYYVESVGNPFHGYRRMMKQERSGEWFEAFIEPRATSRIWINVSDQTGKIEGIVREKGEAVPGVPVFLWPVEIGARRSLGGAREYLSDTEGRFRFVNLPPGEYRLVASFDIDEIDPDWVDLSQARSVRAEAGQIAALELSVWQAP